MGGTGKKQNGFGYNSWPDKQYFKPRVTRTLWVEYKRSAKHEPTEGQKEIHKLLRQCGQKVIVTHDPEVVAAEFKKLCD